MRGDRGGKNDEARMTSDEGMTQHKWSSLAPAHNPNRETGGQTSEDRGLKIMIGGLLASLGHGVTVFGSGHLLGSHNRGAEAAPTLKDNAAGSRVYICHLQSCFQ